MFIKRVPRLEKKEDTLSHPVAFVRDESGVGVLYSTERLPIYGTSPTCHRRGEASRQQPTAAISSLGRGLRERFTGTRALAERGFGKGPSFDVNRQTMGFCFAHRWSFGQMLQRMLAGASGGKASRWWLCEDSSKGNSFVCSKVGRVM
jgi:hypothetical protein